jgi:hypothetical protein
MMTDKSITVKMVDHFDDRKAEKEIQIVFQPGEISIIVEPSEDDETVAEELVLEYWNGHLILRHYDDSNDDGSDVLWKKKVEEEQAPRCLFSSPALGPAVIPGLFSIGLLSLLKEWIDGLFWK